LNYKQTKERIDRLLVIRAYAETREKAKALVMEGQVFVNGIRVEKPGAMIPVNGDIQITSGLKYVSRGGLKLEEAIRLFSIQVAEKVAIDVGASTGGFTDCLLQHGASRVYAVDVGYGQFDWKLRNNPRVILLERTNIRYLEKSLIPESVDIATVDVSFISLVKVLPKVREFLKESAEIIALIKPQFEVGKGQVGKGGIVRDPQKHLAVVESIKTASITMGFHVKGTIKSPLSGAKGNEEYFIYLLCCQKPCCVD